VQISFPCPHCRRTLTENYNLGMHAYCQCDGAKAERAKRRAAESTPAAKAARAERRAKLERESAESGVRAAEQAVKIAESRLYCARQRLASLPAPTPEPVTAKAYDTLRGPKGFDWDRCTGCGGQDGFHRSGCHKG